MRYILLIVHFFMICCCMGQDKDLNYVIDFITVKQGLSHNYVTSIISDDLNMKWMGTENGITKFNGYDFQYIKPSPHNSGLLNENIEVLFKDSDSNLWIGTKSGGLSLFDIKKNTITGYNSILENEKDKDLRITAVYEDNEGSIWVGTWDRGVFVIDAKQKKMLRHFNYRNPIYSIKKDHLGNMWFSSNKTAFKYSLKTKKIKRLDFDFSVSDILPDQKRNKVWISTTSKNDYLYAYQLDNGELDSLRTNVHSNFSKKLMLDNQNRIWIGTWGNGVFRSNTKLTEFSKLDLIGDFPGKIEGNYSTILSLHEDQNNIVWLSTASGGVVKLQEGNGFQNLAQNINNSTLKEKLNCTSLHKNKDYLFIGTLFAGVYYGKDFNQLSKIEAIGNVKVNAFYEFDKKLYIGTADGFYVFDLETQEIIFANRQIKKATSFLIQNKTLYIGTQQNGVAVIPLDKITNRKDYVFFAENQDERSGLKSNRITSIKADQNQNIWVTSYKGLHLLDKEKNTFVHHSKFIDKEVSINIINSLELVGSLLWLSTPNGLFKLNFKNKALQFQEVIGKKDGLNSDFICATTFDNNLNLWISTHTEIVKYNKADQTLTSYGETNGVKTSLFNNNVTYNYDNKTIFFGGIDNITYFDPKSIKDYNTVPQVIFTGLRIKNEKVNYTENQNTLTESFNYTEKIQLDYKDDFFSVRFVANDFLGKLNIKYRYILEGYQNQWVDLNSMNEINFAGLSSGSYTLKVQASRDNQNWSAPSTLKINLAGSPWKSNFAFLMYFLVLLSLISYFLWLNNYKLKLKNKLALAKLDEQKKIELTEAKLNFFTNISHEFRTPLTLITSPLKELLEYKDFPPKVYKSLNYIDKNTSRLLTLINQLLDFRKAEFGTLKLKVSNGNFVRFSKEVFLYFKEAAKAKQITYKFNATEEIIFFPFDRMKMEIVLCNLLSNAIKFTKHGGFIEMSISKTNENCIISVKDNGIGIKSKNLEKIFNKFYQIESDNSAQIVGSGIGLSFSKKIVELHHGDISVKSKSKTGTEFIVKLAIDPAIYAGEIDESFKTTDDIEAYDKSTLEESKKDLGIHPKKISVLIVDDNPEILNYLNDILEHDYEILKAENGQEGVDVALKCTPDLIVSDVMMPVKDGIELCKELKANIKTSHIPILLLTARTSTVFEIDGLENGADDYITKPFNSQIVRARITSLLLNREKAKIHFLNKVRFEPTNQDIKQANDKEDSFIEKAIHMVENNLQNENFGIETMQEELNMSRSSLFRKIKSLTGLSLSAFIRSVRIKKAAHLILTEDMSLKEIAFSVGFNTYKYFKISFKKQFDCLPSKYKEMHKNSCENP